MSTYQAASGAGAEGMEELLQGTALKLENKPVENKVFAHPLPFNLIPHIDKFQVSPPQTSVSEPDRHALMLVRLFNIRIMPTRRRR